jgi:hypothetical protein
MAIPKKSLTNKVSTTRKAIVASSARTKENPSTPVAARLQVREGRATRVRVAERYLSRLTMFAD